MLSLLSRQLYLHDSAMQPCNKQTLPCSVCQDSCTAQRFQRLVSVLQGASGLPPAWQAWLDSSSSMASSPPSSQQGHTPAAWLQRLASTPLQGSMLAGTRSALPRTAVRGPVLQQQQPRSAPPAPSVPSSSSRPAAARRLAFDPAKTSSAAAPPAAKLAVARYAVQGQSAAPRKRKQGPASEDAFDTPDADRVRLGVPIKAVPRSSGGGMQSQHAASAPRRQDPFSPAATDGSDTSSTGFAADRQAVQLDAAPVHRLRRSAHTALKGPTRAQALRSSAAAEPVASSWRLDSSSSGSSAASSPTPGHGAPLPQHRSGLQQQPGRPQGPAALPRNASGFVLQQQQQVLRALLGWLESLPQEEQLQQLQSSLPYLHQALSPLKGDS